MKLPRNVDGVQLVKSLRTLGYEVTRQKGSHMRITTQLDGEHHEVIPAHKPIKPGTLPSILKSIANHHKLPLPELIHRIGI
jgi:predicted RNA binding protein YcfA (HicA-like mRNA interferase family)